MYLKMNGQSSSAGKSNHPRKRKRPNTRRVVRFPPGADRHSGRLLFDLHGHRLTGFGFFLTSLAALTGTFVFGRLDQRNERQEKQSPGGADGES
jgi:hypothetical protein